MVRKKNKMFVDSADRTPHYSLRKLSVGVASVLLSTTLWMGANGSVAHADTNNNATVAGKVEDKLDPSETHKDQTQAQTAESTSQASVASAEKQNGEAQKGQAQVAVANANQAEKKQAQKVDSADAEAQTPTANDAHAQADVAKQESAAQSQQTAPQAQVPASAERQASTTLDVRQAFKMHINKKMVMASLARTNMASSISELEKANEDTTAVPGFSVTDPEYPSEMYRDPDSKYHYSFFWAGGLTDNGYHYQTVISTNRTGDGQIHVFELDQSNKVFNSFDLDKNKSHKSRWTGATYYNDEYAGLINAGSNYWTGSQGELTLKYEVSGGKIDHPMNSISFIVPRLNTQVTSYQREDGKDIIDNNGKKIEPVVQQGLDGQKYTTTGTKVIDGYYAKAPSNAQGTMSPYGKIDSTYEINMHNGYSAVFTQTDNDGTMSVQMYQEDLPGYKPVNGPIPIRPGDNGIYSGVDGIYLRSIYVPQTIDIRYVYKKLGSTYLVGEDNKPFMGNTPTQYPNDPKDPTKAGKVVIHQYEGYTPTIKGVPVSPYSFIPTDPGEDTYVVYTPDAQKATVAYIDDKTGQTIGTKTLTGVTNAKSGYTTADSIKT
ncbi:YSIRK-type signal peptide-containing protein, partial [Lactobacillus gallinarum]|uniref:YSIRK-type signal peptide-containing protein n=1 Tax=Lactobacillus gallinarum TaxID=52242 RepID=UPI00195B498E